MATPTPKRSSSSPSPAARSLPDVVDPAWLLKALAAAIAAAAVFAYLAVCLLIYQGGWQRLLFPSTRVDQTPASFGIPFQPVRFDSAQAGTPRLTGWWMPDESSPGTEPNTRVILFLHDGTGSLSTSIRTLALLHRAKVRM